MNKRGITMTSIIVYVMLFFVFTSLAIAITSNMNYEALGQKGSIINYEQIQKLQFNMLNSAKKSNAVYNINEKIVFSNNDEYYYDSENSIVLKNNSILLTDVEDFKIIDSYEEIGNSIKDSNVCIEITLKKYGNEKKERLVFSVGDVNE